MSLYPTLSHRNEEPEKGVLYIVGTPIGNLNDISNRALNILKNVSLIACEDTRQTKKLMSRFSISNKLISFNQHNSYKKISIIIDNLKGGYSVALVSDAGMPSICDPGEDLIINARLKNIDVICIPGPCAAITALVASGMPSSNFCFEGFLPKKKVEREEILYKISRNEQTTILYESPHRITKLLKELKDFCGGEREIHVSRELTKKFEEHICNSIDELLSYFENIEVLGEITVVIKGRKKLEIEKFNKSILKKELCDLIEAGLSLSAASKYLAKKNKLKKSLIYDLY